MNFNIADNNDFDRLFHIFINRHLGINPAFNLSILDWLIHFSISPYSQIQFIINCHNKLLELITSNYYYISNSQEEYQSKINKIINNDKRFNNDNWNKYPFNLYIATFLLLEQLGKETINSVTAQTKHHKLINHFIWQQLVNIISPKNYILTNPEIQKITQEQSGYNFIKGFNNFIEDIYLKLTSQPAIGLDQFKVGKNLAVTPGKVVYKNELIELIQYTPTANKVYKEPVLIVPACIMKYYILDLSQHNSLVKYLNDMGHTVFMISWKNPEYKDNNLGFDDYINMGIIAALDAVSEIIPDAKIHTAGYCLGGTMLAITAAYMAAKADERLKTITLLAAQVDFKAAGELLVFMDESQVSMLKDQMWQSGYLDGQQMAAAFNIMHSSELIWGKMIQDYLIGERNSLFDVMAWNADLTRLPCKMHSEYLDKLFINNSLADGEFTVNEEAVLLSNINAPIFAVGTTADHVAPWKSVYKINFLTKVESTFVLTTGGHNVGIVSEPGHKGRSYQVMTKKLGANCINQGLWQKIAPTKEGSWWLEWQSWLSGYSDPNKVLPPNMGNNKKGYPVLYDAPGKYVLQK